MSNLINTNQELVLDSREVAGMVGKEHKELLRDIRTYEDYLGESNFALTDFFVPNTYMSSQNKELPCYYITKKGCEFIAHKLTGQKGATFTATYINRFHEMDKRLNIQLPKLSKELQAIFAIDQRTLEIDSRVSDLENNVSDLESNMPLFNVECKELQALVRKVATRVLGGYRSPAYCDNSLRGKVYSDIQNQLKREFGVERCEAIKRSQLGQAKEILSSYKAPLILVQEIQLENRQIAI